MDIDHNVIKELPVEMILAREQDFFDELQDPKIDMHFVLQSMKDGHYRWYKTSEKGWARLENIKPWINQGLCWIEKSNVKPKTNINVKKVFDGIKFDF